MTIAESIAKAVEALPAAKQHEALAIIERLGQEKRNPLVSPEGLAANAGFDISLEEFQALRHEMWGNGSDREREWTR